MSSQDALRYTIVYFTVVALLLPAPVCAQSMRGSASATSPSVAVGAERRTTAIVIDGVLDESGWQVARPATDFVQIQPREGESATQRSEIRFLIDDHALYIGARMYDTEGAAGVRTRLVRRDQETDSDFLQLVFDTYHDHLGRTAFGVNPSGVKFDAHGPGGAPLDVSWDAVWEVATRVDSLGWTAELRIPFTQLRYPRDSIQTWGVQLYRMQTRLNELSMWSFWRLNEVGGPRFFGHLEGMQIAKAPGRVEFLPYVVGRSTNVRRETGDPFHGAHEVDGRVGGDFKALLTSNLTLTGTVNPDFGQVEVDPAIVNLSAFETYFAERRPFFVEGSGMFDFGSVGCMGCSRDPSLNLFYSRRIGREPQGAGNGDAPGQWADVPENSRILGAAKVTGRSGGGWSIGLLDALTARELARVQTAGGVRGDVEVEPFTNYFVGRVARDLAGGDATIGGIVTSAIRDFGDPLLRTQLADHSEVAGVETSLRWQRRTYRLSAHAAVSQVAGDSLAILRVQRSSARYFHRPDRGNGSNGAFSDAFDRSRTTLRGYAAALRVAKEGGDWLWEATASARSPGFEANDVAFNTRADYVWMGANVARQFTRPNSFARRMHFLVGGDQTYNYDGDIVSRNVRAGATFQFHNYWNVVGKYNYSPLWLDDRLARGGPVLAQRPTHEWFLVASSDARRAVVVSASSSVCVQEGRPSTGVSVGVTVKPAANWSFGLEPSYSAGDSRNQWVTSVADTTAVQFYGRRYVFANLTQRELALGTRVSVTFAPTLTLELFAQPLISSARYTGFKEFDRPRSTDRSTYGVERGTIAAANGVYTVDPDGPAWSAAPFSFANPDFNFRSLRGNAVLRWEFRPGSVLYLAWTQTREDAAPIGDFQLGRDARALLATRPDNIFLVKLSYWLGM